MATSVYLWLSRPLSGYLRLSLSLAISGFLGLSLAISSYPCLSHQAIPGFLRLPQATLGYLGLSWAISGYLWLSLAICNYIGLCLAISGYPYRILRIRVQVQARESKLLPFETFSFLFFFSHKRVIEELVHLEKTKEMSETPFCFKDDGHTLNLSFGQNQKTRWDFEIWKFDEIEIPLGLICQHSNNH